MKIVSGEKTLPSSNFFPTNPQKKFKCLNLQGNPILNVRALKLGHFANLVMLFSFLAFFYVTAHNMKPFSEMK